MKEFQDRFIDAFSDALLDGKHRELIVEYSSVLRYITKEVWYARRQGEKTEYSLKRLENNCHYLLQAAADSKEEISKILFLKLMNELYRDISSDYIRQEKGLFREKVKTNTEMGNENSTQKRTEECTRTSADEQIKASVPVCEQTFKILNDFNFFEFFSKIFSEIGIRNLARTINMAELLCNIQITDLCLFIENIRPHIDSNSINSWRVDCSITDIQKFIGSYLRAQATVLGITIDNYSQFANNCILESWRIDSLTATAEVKERLRIVFSYENAVYICGLIDAGMYNLAKDVFSQYFRVDYQFSYHHYYSVDDFIFIIAPFCYLYYLGFWEKDEYVEAEIRKQAQWLAQELSGQYKEVLRTKNALEFLKSELLYSNPSSRSYLYGIMRMFDAKTKYRIAYVIVTDNLVRDFCLFSILCSRIGNYNMLDGFGSDGFAWLDDKSDYTFYINEKDATLKKLIDFVKFMGYFKELREANSLSNNDLYAPSLQAEKLFERLKDAMSPK